MIARTGRRRSLPLPAPAAESPAMSNEDFDGPAFIIPAIAITTMRAANGPP
jgi:hypothetical protein